MVITEAISFFALSLTKLIFIENPAFVLALNKMMIYIILGIFLSTVLMIDFIFQIVDLTQNNLQSRSILRLSILLGMHGEDFTQSTGLLNGSSSDYTNITNYPMISNSLESNDTTDISTIKESVEVGNITVHSTLDFKTNLPSMSTIIYLAILLSTLEIAKYVVVFVKSYRKVKKKGRKPVRKMLVVKYSVKEQAKDR